MKPTIHSFFSLLLATAWGVGMLTGCTATDGAEPDADADGVPLQITSVSVRSVQPQPATRADYFYDAKTKDLGLFRASTGGSYYAGEQKNFRYTFTTKNSPHMESGGGYWFAWSMDMITLHTQNADICAYMPYNAAYTDKTAIPLTSGAYTDDLDVCYATNQTKNAYNPNISFEMKHAMALLVLYIKKAGNHSKDCRLTEINLWDVPHTSTINISNGTYGTAFGWNELKKTFGGDQLITTTPLETGILLVPFKPADGKLMLTLKVNGGYYNVPVTLSELKAGYKYGVTITINPTYLEVTGVYTASRDEVTVGGDGKVWTPEPLLTPVGVYLTADRMNVSRTECTAEVKKNLAGLVWARGYLKSAGTDTSVKDYEMAMPVEQGYYYLWQSSFTGEGSSSRNGVDPCTLLKPEKYGIGWRTPNKQELEWLSYCTDLTPAKLKGVSGMWAMRRDEGLFMPFTGERSNCGTTPTEGETKYIKCWSSYLDQKLQQLPQPPYQLMHNFYYNLYCILNSATVEVTEKQGPVGATPYPDKAYSVRCVKTKP